MSASLIFAIPSKGRLKEQVEAWLADAGFRLDVAGGARGYRAALSGLSDAEVRLLSASDIAAAVDSGEVERHAIDRPHHAVARKEMRGQVADL